MLLPFLIVSLGLNLVLFVAVVCLYADMEDYKSWYDTACRAREVLSVENQALRKANGTLHTEKIDALNLFNSRVNDERLLRQQIDNTKIALNQESELANRYMKHHDDSCVLLRQINELTKPYSSGDEE